MNYTLCDYCGDKIQNRSDVVRIAVFAGGGKKMPFGEAPDDVIDMCQECGNSLLVHIKQRKLDIRRYGKVVEN